MRWDLPTLAGFVAAPLVLAIAVLGAAVGGSWQLEDRHVTRDVAELPILDRLFERFQRGPFATEQPPADPTIDWSWVAVVGRILLVALSVLVLWRLWTWLRRRSVPRSRRPVRDAGSTAVVVDEPELPVLRRGVAEAQRFLALRSGPTDAVVAAWLALEDAAAASGVRRLPSQTPTEFTVAVLELTDADPDATTELLSLYHRARFSSSPIGPDDVARASRCFTDIAASWTARAASRERVP